MGPINSVVPWESTFIRNEVRGGSKSGLEAFCKEKAVGGERGGCLIEKGPREGRRFRNPRLWRGRHTKQKTKKK